MKKLIILILTIGTFFAILAGGMVFLAATVVSANSGYSATETSVLSGELKNGVREIKVGAFKYGFKPDPIVVNKGEKVKLIATTTDIDHGIAIPEYGIKVSLKPNQSKAIEFVADKAGEFHIHCSVYCGPGHSKMHGSLIVK